ncbi:MAG: hypothetical protein Q4E53_08815 [Eubacteriales bacterium]|nr:hypothetical protein [Eubacteriales bacterium]
MMKHLNKVLWAIVMLVVLTATLTITTGIFNPKSQPTAQVESTITAQIPHGSRTAIKYEYYYRVYNGWTQKHLWNRTAGKWAEPYWHNVERVKK